MYVFLFLVVVVFYVVYRSISGLGNFSGGGSNQSTYVDKTTHVHHHYHDNRSVHVDGERFDQLNQKK